MPKVFIMYKFSEGPWGGGNQFLKALRNQLIELGKYTEKIAEADCILFNSHQNLNDVFEYKLKYPEKLFVHRVDGPVFLARGRDLNIDQTIFLTNDLLADITIFQSVWSKNECLKIGYRPSEYESIIYNAPDKSIFSSESAAAFDKEVIGLIATSWSGNIRKGFEFYKFLDQNLDRAKYRFTFVGNSPIKFENALHLQPVGSRELAKLLKDNHIFISASFIEACSNSIIEALSCGLPAIVPNATSNPEVIGHGGETFETKEELLEKIDLVAKNYEDYKNRVVKPNIEKVATQYMEIMTKAYNDKLAGRYNPKRVSRLARFVWRMKQKGYDFLERYKN